MQTSGTELVLVKCRDCNGSGRNSQARDGRCSTCGGLGQVWTEKRSK